MDAPVTRPFCQRHQRTCTAICKSLSCPTVFVCEERECIVGHFHSREFLNVYFIEKLVEDSRNMQDYICKEVEEKVENYYERACQEFNQAINQHKEMTLTLLDTLKVQITLEDSTDHKLLDKMRGDSIYLCTKQEILRGWQTLSNASTIVTKEKDIGYLIREINKAVERYQANFQKCQKSYLKRMFDFQGSVFKELADLEISKEQYDTLNELLIQKDVDLRRCKMVFNAKEHNFSAAKFHEVCNGMAQTVTLVRSANNRLFGGYTHGKWSSSNNWEADSQGFLFSVDNKCRCGQHQNPTYALYQNGTYGPTWGGNHDLHIADGCGSNNSSYSNMGYTFKADDPKVDQTFTLAGERNFKVVNYLILQLDP